MSVDESSRERWSRLNAANERMRLNVKLVVEREVEGSRRHKDTKRCVPPSHVASGKGNQTLSVPVPGSVYANFSNAGPPKDWWWLVLAKDTVLASVGFAAIQHGLDDGICSVGGCRSAERHDKYSQRHQVRELVTARLRGISTRREEKSVNSVNQR